MPLSAPRTSAASVGFHTGFGSYSFGIGGPRINEQEDLAWIRYIAQDWAERNWIYDAVVPLGGGDLASVVEPGVQVPDVGAETNWIAEADVNEEIDRRDELPDEGVVSEPITDLPNMIYVTDWFMYHEAIAAGYTEDQIVWGEAPVDQPPVVTEPAPAPAPTPTPTPEPEESDMGWLSDLYEDIDEEYFGGYLPGGSPPGGTPGTPAPPGTTAPPMPGVPPAPGAPGMPAPTTQQQANPYRGYVYKLVCGQWRWVKPKRRRRRALVTQSDIRGLAALKGVVGQGKTMDVWIATHST